MATLRGAMDGAFTLTILRTTTADDAHTPASTRSGDGTGAQGSAAGVSTAGPHLSVRVGTCLEEQPDAVDESRSAGVHERGAAREVAAVASRWDT